VTPGPLRLGRRWRAALGWPAALLVLTFPLTACSAQDSAEAQNTAAPRNTDVRPSGPVSDRADILPAAEEAVLDARLRDYFRRTGNAIVVASVTTLEGRPIENVAMDTFNAWGIGDRRTNRGLLVLVAPNERQMRIEVGCGLEKPISYDVAKQIIEQQMVPPFRSGDFAGGIDSGVDALIVRLDRATEFGATSEACLQIMKEAA
jgi:uncharacterized protein